MPHLIGIPATDQDKRTAEEWARFFFWREAEAHGLDAPRTMFVFWLLEQGKLDGGRWLLKEQRRAA